MAYSQLRGAFFFYFIANLDILTSSMQLFRTRNLFILTLLLGIAPTTFAAPFAPNETVDPNCVPSNPVCIVDPGWNVDITSGYVYTGTSPENYLVGIGTATPSAQLDVVGDIEATAADTVVSNDGTHNAFEFTTDLSSSTGDIDQTNYRGVASSLTWNGSDSYDGLSADPQSLSAIYGVVSNNGTGIVDAMTGIVGRTVNTTTGAINEANSGLFQIINLGNGDIGTAEGLEGSVSNLANGSITDAKGGNFTVSNSGAGVIGDAFGVTASVNNTSTGSISQAISTTNEIRNSNAGGLITVANSFDNKIKALAGTISSAIGMRFDQYAVGGGSIGEGVGIQFVASLHTGDGLQPSIEATNDVYGIRFSGNTGTAALDAGGDAFGIYFAGDSINAGGMGRALYVEDGAGENFFGNGLRIGTDDTDHKIDDDSNGAGTATLFIGNETIDTSVSDRRLKTNIEDAHGSALSFLSDFRVVQFDWLPENDRSELGSIPFGLIAQEVEEVSPQFVKKPDDPSSYMSVRFADLVPSLIKAVQELQKQISDLTTDAIGNIQNLIVETITGHRATFDELCVGNTCVDEETFAQVVAEIQGNSNDEDSPDDQSDNNENTSPDDNVSDDENTTDDTPADENSDSETQDEPTPEPESDQNTPEENASSDTGNEPVPQSI